MLTDSSLTNILAVSGVSQIRYRAYSQHAKKESLADYLSNAPSHDKKNELELLRAYKELIALNIPAFWRITSESSEPENDILLELWVFWFDERHTGKIDANDDLYALEEIKVGSFTWENAYSKIQSPTTSPVASSMQSGSSTPVTVSDEYKWFIKSVRNLIHTQMKKKGAYPLGEFYIFPSNDQDVIADVKNSSSAPNLSKSTSSPNTRRMRLRPVTLQTTRTRGKKVILCPTGETVIIAGKSSNLAPQTEEAILRKWSSLLDIPYTNLLQSQMQQYSQTAESKSQTQAQTQQPQPQQQQQLPNLVAIKNSTSDEAYYYPTRLMFVSSSSKISPTAMAGANGLFGFNQGFSEDLGDKWHRWAWSERISNYWEYACPRDNTASLVLDTLSQENGQTNNSSLLQKAINEPVIASPLMATKSVATPGSATGNQRNEMSTPSSSINYEDDDQMQTAQSVQPTMAPQKTKSRYQSNMSLVDFALANFSVPNSTNDLIEYPLATGNTPTLNHASNGQPPEPQQPEDQQQQQSSNTLVPQDNGAANGYQPPNLQNLELNSYDMTESMDVDSMVLDIPNRWNDDGMDDLDNFDFGVTEEDFDFFESSTPAAAAAATAPPAMTTAPNLISNSTFDPLSEDLLMQDVKVEEDPATVGEAFEIHDDKTLVTLDHKQHMVDTDMDIQNDASVTPLQVGLAQRDYNNKPFEHHQHQESGIAQDLQDYHHQLFVPPQFAPIKMDSVVNDSKYIQGGKFTYPGSEKQSRSKHSMDYRPDYVPVVRSRKNKKRKSSNLLLLDTIKKENEPLILESNKNTNQATNDTENQSSSSSEDDDDDDSSSGSSMEESDSENEHVEGHINEEYSESAENQDDDDVDSLNTRAITANDRAQTKYVELLARLDSNDTRKKITLDDIVLGYDSPFARTVADSIIRVGEPRKNANEYEETKALDYLCQQAVMGGYPFSGGIEAMSSNGFEANEGESAKVVIARRRDLLQKFYGDAIHVPSTPSDVDFMTQNFKHVLSDIFYQQKKTITGDIDGMCIDSLPLPVSVTVKGPLNVQDYYELSETNQAHSKYGKYQVKKRRPAEPNLGTLQPPNIAVNRQEDVIEGTSKLIMFWEKLRLEPYSSKKHVNYFVMYPKNESIESHILHFFKGLSTLYETCQLGAHHPGNMGPYRRGLVPVPLLPQREGEAFQDRQLRSYFAECQNLGTSIGSAMAENVHIVIYMINPSTHLGSNLDLSRCFTKLKGAYQAASVGLGSKINEKTRARLVLQLMPIEHVLRSTSFGGCLKFGLRQVAFSVYSKCHAVVSRQQHHINKKDPHPVADLYAPPFVLSKPIPTQIQFKLKKAISSFPSILESHAVMHMGYTFSLDRRWMIIVWTDNLGEMVEFAILDNRGQHKLSSVFREAWHRTKQISKRTGFSWTFVICKIGLVFEDELKAWISCLPSNEQVAIVSMDVESTLFVNTTNMDTTMSDLHSPADSLSASTPNMMNATATTKKHYSDTAESGQTKALLLNHRVAYSNKRERMSYGILGLDSLSKEDWMIPLASGYMIHTPPATENPNNELFNCNPLVLEIHLVYNQTSHSAYSTLRDIIKKYHALSFVNIMPSNSNCFPIHLALVERLSRILLVAVK